MTDYQIRYFIEVVKRGSITAAANAMYISQPTVSNNISALEKDCGYKLLVRKPSGVELTEAGRVMYHCFLRIEHDLTASQRDGARLALGSKEKLFIGCLNLTHSAPVQACIREYSQKNDRLMLEMICDDSVKLISDVLTGELDMALLFDNHIENIPDISSIELARSQYVIVMSPRHPLAKKQSVSPNDLFKYDFFFSYLNKYLIPNLEHMEKPNTFGSLRNFGNEIGINPDRVQYRPNFESIFAQIDVTDGLTVVDENVYLLLSDRFVTIPTGIYHKVVAAWRTNNQNGTLHSLLNHLKTALSKE